MLVGCRLVLGLVCLVVVRCLVGRRTGCRILGAA